ncbi:MAG: phosphatase RsbU N-terminal domain-containing protein [Gammaproteobacteria bacterium]|nr:phosphatase RsbU N-terminal domain-containing protein [Gammaproteobacteria bacterium]
MTKTENPRQQVYQELLSAYLTSGGGEKALTVAYEIGRKDLQNGIGLLEIAETHQQALNETLSMANDCVATQSAMNRAASHFLKEALSAFEVSRLCNRQTNDVLIKLYDVFENEAKRIAHRLHDESAQMLAVVYLELAEIANSSPGDTAKRIGDVVGHLDQVSSQLRSLSHELRPIILDRLGLMPALRALADGVRKRSQLLIEVTGDTEGRLSASLEIVLYRAVQEALANVCRHARASHVDVHVWREANSLYCAVSDDGIGIQLSTDGTTISQGLGLIGITERARALGGICDVSSRPNFGTTLQVTVPL